ncbi:DUF2721 domain-containing protein [Dyadobacter psychrotolerans]|uniref:DUF2721 domain-containing protein n=1 Tax=Dyadobacter psychrotolerans TaxID=2541721 RepID=A0A4R5DC65_9BACT|nr:DUF2721 domain-containing protein [Dyadobacter psychrotolerans]TDE10537.1 DUF2721 domain-containing protein [Dyadobacter psychrotolerans]
MNTISQTLTILSSMIAPVVLILACGSLITTTSQRLSRVIERSRKLTEQLKQLVRDHDASSEVITKEGAKLFYQLNKSTLRTNLLQRAMVTLYLCLSLFVATSISLGIMDIFNAKHTWLPVLLSIIGALMLFYVSVLLIRESSLALKAISNEMDDALLFFKKNLEGLPVGSKEKWWRQLRLWQRLKPKTQENKKPVIAEQPADQG